MYIFASKSECSVINSFNKGSAVSLDEEIQKHIVSRELGYVCRNVDSKHSRKYGSVPLIGLISVICGSGDR